jgi:hypothetical protein
MNLGDSDVLQAGENFNLILGGEFLRLSVIDKDV